MTRRQVQEIYRRFQKGKTLEQLAKLYHVDVVEIEAALRAGHADAATPKPAVYQLEARLDQRWLPLEPYRGSGAKARAIMDGKELSTWPTYQALRVMKTNDPIPVWNWTRKA